MAMKLVGRRWRAVKAEAQRGTVARVAQARGFKTPQLRLDPEGEPQRFYEHTSVALGEVAGRRAYFKRLEAANPQARFEHLSARNSIRARDLRVELEVLMRIEGSRGAGFYLTGDSAFEQRIIVVDELPVMGASVNDEAAVAAELADLNRICRAVGFTIFYGVRDLGEFKAKGWGSEGIFNASCNTQVQVDSDGLVVDIQRADDGQLNHVYGQIRAA